MHPIIRFYLNDAELNAKLGFSIYDILNAKNGWLERCHNYIQWAFPLREPSRFNPDAPLLTDEVIAEFRNEPALRNILYRVYHSMVTFLGFHPTDNKWNTFIFDELEVRSVDFMRQNDFLWLNPNDHNFLRITRILTSLRLLGLQAEANHLFGLLSRLYSYPEYGKIIGETTWKFWQEAMECGT